MLRTILGVIAGYVVMSVVLFALFSGLYMVLGTSGSFQADSYSVSMTWQVAGLVVFFVGSAVAGLVCALISKKANAGMIMGIVILIVGLLMGAAEMMQAAAPIRDAAEVGMMEAMGQARNATWALIINPFVGLIGAITGGKLKGGE